MGATEVLMEEEIEVGAAAFGALILALFLLGLFESEFLVGIPLIGMLFVWLNGTVILAVTGWTIMAILGLLSLLYGVGKFIYDQYIK